MPKHELDVLAAMQKGLDVHQALVQGLKDRQLSPSLLLNLPLDKLLCQQVASLIATWENLQFNTLDGEPGCAQEVFIRHTPSLHELLLGVQLQDSITRGAFEDWTHTLVRPGKKLFTVCHTRRELFAEDMARQIVERFDRRPANLHELLSVSILHPLPSSVVVLDVPGRPNWLPVFEEHIIRAHSSTKPLPAGTHTLVFKESKQ